MEVDVSRLLPGWANLLIIPGLIAGFTVHELAHAFVAYWLGDMSQIERGRISLNPFRHISWLGLLTFVFFGFGWAKPVRFDSRRFKQRYRGIFLVSVAGSVANLLLAGLSLGITLGLILVVTTCSAHSALEIMQQVTAEPTGQPDILAWTAAFTIQPMYANLALALFNLLPLPGLDGFSVLVSLIRWLRSSSPGQARSASHQNSIRQSAAAEAPLHRQPADIHLAAGLAYQAEGKYEDAIARYRQALAYDQSCGLAYVNLGLAHLALNQHQRAIQAFRGAIRYAADEASRAEAWVQLQQLSQGASQDMPETPFAALDAAGHSKAVHPVPNWLTFGLRSALLLLGLGCIYLYLAIGLIRHFS